MASVHAASHTFVPENNATNQVLPGTGYSQGITLQDHSTECTYARLTGPLRLNGGTLRLNNNVSSNRSLILATGGTIDGRGLYF